MADENVAGPAGGEQTSAPIAVHSTSGEGPLTARDAARSLVDWRRKSTSDNAGQEVSAEPATPEPAHESATADAAPPQEANGETQAPDPAAEPSIDPPKSWTKEAKDRFASLPRDTQEYIAAREQERDREVRRSQNEAAEQRKVFETERQKVAQAQQQYEQALPVLMQNLHAAMAGEFSDIQSQADVMRMATEDPFRYAKWDAAQKQVAAVQQEAQNAQHRRSQEWQTQISDFMNREAEKFVELAPEAKDPAQLTKLQNSAVSMLNDLGFQKEELSGLWRGDSGVSIHDHRLQLIIRDAVKWREAQSKGAEVAQKKLPPVAPQRPGTAPSRGAGREAELTALQNQVEKSSGLNQLRASAKLLAARRRA